MYKKILIPVLLLVCMCIFTACSAEEEKQEDVALLEPANAKIETTYVTRMDISQVELHDGAVIPSIEEFSFDVD
ncbi:MAG: hypothetical protein IK007_09120, partial [Lachnospiraceae bacterium]|nr:hypothetical protein [Lachnospiraceae bacterium]